MPTARSAPAIPPLVIAEIGINHGGDLAVAKEMVRLAAGAGCEMIKHQTHIIEDEMTEEAKSIFPPNADVSIWHVMERCALTLDEEAELKRYTESLGMIWISTPFQPRGRRLAGNAGRARLQDRLGRGGQPAADPPHRAQGQAGDPVDGDANH